jgi:hypothetical protein
MSGVLNERTLNSNTNDPNSLNLDKSFIKSSYNNILTKSNFGKHKFSYLQPFFADIISQNMLVLLGINYLIIKFAPSVII